MQKLFIQNMANFNCLRITILVFCLVAIFEGTLSQQEEDWDTVREQSEDEILRRISDIEGVDVLRGNSYRLSLLLPDVNLYYTKDGQNITLNSDIHRLTKVSMENDLDEELGPQSLVEVVAIAKHLVTAQDIIDNGTSQSSEVNIAEILDSPIRLDLEDAIEIETEARFYYAPDTLDAEEVERLSTSLDYTEASSDSETTTPSAPERTRPTHPSLRTSTRGGNPVGPPQPTRSGNPVGPPQPSRRKRNIKISNSWGTAVNYRISSEFSIIERAMIEDAIGHWENETCIRFNKVTTSEWLLNGLNFMKKATSNNCGSSPVGKKQYGNYITLVTTSSCFVQGVIEHEIGLSLGFWLEHMRPDRDEYVTINWDNIPWYLKHAYHKKCWGNTRTYGVPYDYSSVMHYRAGNRLTLKDETMTGIAGQRVGLSFTDSKQANYYLCPSECPNYNTLEWSECEHGGYRDPNDCSACRCPLGWTGTYCQTMETDDEVCGTFNFTATATMQSLVAPSTTGQVDCAWVITAPTSGTVFVRFSGTFSMRGTSRGVCTDDYVEIRSKSEDQTGARHCGPSTPSDTYESTTNKLMVVFHSDNLLSSDTFNIEYWTGSCGLCGSHYAPQQTCNRKHSDVCYSRYTVSCGWWGRRCNRYRSQTCYKQSPSCCHGQISNGNCDVGCGGCTDSHVKNQPSCSTKQYKTEYYSYSARCGWGRRCRKTGSRSVYSHTTYSCCDDYQLSADNTRCIKRVD